MAWSVEERICIEWSGAEGSGMRLFGNEWSRLMQIEVEWSGVVQCSEVI